LPAALALERGAGRCDARGLGDGIGAFRQRDPAGGGQSVENLARAGISGTCRLAGEGIGCIVFQSTVNPWRPAAQTTPSNPLETQPISGRELAITAARFADTKQAEEIVILDLRGLCNIADYFVICSANSPPHLNAVRREVADRLKVEHGVASHGHDGAIDSLWTVLDFIDVVVHILHREKREFYAIENLWAKAPRVEWQPEGEPQA
jgi:ribosome-associated protein